MSNIQLFESGNALPSYIKNVESNLKDMTFAGGAGGKRISIKGGVWRMIVDGEEVAKNKDRHMNLVVVNMAPNAGRKFYNAEYEEGVDAVPVCWSADGKTPDLSSTEIQNSSCELCPKNIKGSGKGDSRACRFSRNLAVVLENDLGGDVFKLELPAMSLFGEAVGNQMPLEAYRKFLKGHGIPLDCVVSKMEFDTDAAVPKLFFSAVRPLNEQEFHTCQEQGKSSSGIDAAKFDYSNASSKKPAQPAQAALPAAFDKPKAQPKAEAAPAPAKAVEKVEAVQAEEVAEPVRRPKKESVDVETVSSVKSILDNWDTDD